MLFLADESCDFSVVRALRAAGYDVVAVADVLPSASDEAVLDPALTEQRTLLTEDKDFGQLVHANMQPSGAVIFIRFPATARSTLARTVVDVVGLLGEEIAGSFVVVQPGRTRSAAAPGRIGGDPWMLGPFRHAYRSSSISADGRALSSTCSLGTI